MVNALKKKEDLLYGKGVSDDVISLAEAELGLSFAKEYREYLSAMGIAAYDGHELTGISKSNRTSVVEVTKLKRKQCSEVPKDWYVIEEANIDDIVIWQKSSGEVYQMVGNLEPKLISKSLEEFIGR